MKKYKCLMCGYVYDPQVGDPDSGVRQVLHSRTCLMIGYVPIAE